VRRLWRAISGAVGWVLNRPVGWERKEEPMRSLYHRAMPPRLRINGLALVLGPIWYFLVGLWVHGAILLSIIFLSGGLLLPFVWLYAALKANEDLLDARLMRRSVY
jgi:hypothetical protein